MNNRYLKVAVVSFLDVSKPISGQQKRVIDLVKGLSNYFNLDYIHYSDYNDTNELALKLKEFGVSYIKLNYGYNRFITKLWITVLYNIIFPFTGFKKSIYIGWLSAFVNRGTISKWNYDIVIVEYFMNAWLFKYLSPGTLKVIDMHDLQFTTLDSFIKYKRFILFRGLPLRVARQFELRTLKRADLLLAVNKNEIEFLKRKLHSRAIFCPLTIDNNKIVNSINKLSLDKIKLAYFSNLSSLRSLNELKYIINIIFKELRVVYGDRVILYVIGSNQSNHIINICKTEGVYLIGEVEDLHKTFQNIHFVINHWLGESYGFRTRVIDALATGTPVITNKKCIDGMGLENKPGILLAEVTEEVIKYLHKYTNDPDSYIKLCDSSLLTVREYLANRVYREVYNEILEYI